jgi:hypothetical protein
MVVGASTQTTKEKEKNMRHYWEVLFSTEYFPYWEFSMLMILALQLSMLWRMHRIEKKIDVLNELSHHIIDEVEE